MCCRIQHFNSRTAWGSSTQVVGQYLIKRVISIPVLRGEVQPFVTAKGVDYLRFQFPYCVGKFNKLRPTIYTGVKIFQFPYCVGKFNIKQGYERSGQNHISIPVLRGEVQLIDTLNTIMVDDISIPVLRGEVQRNKTPFRDGEMCISIPVLRGEVQQHPYVMPDSSIFQNTFSRIDDNPIMHSVHFLYKISKTLILCLVRVSHTFHVCL